MAKINENKLAKRVAAEEGGAVELSIAQIKEVLRLTFEVLGREYSGSEILALIEKHS